MKYIRIPFLTALFGAGCAGLVGVLASVLVITALTLFFGLLGGDMSSLKDDIVLAAGVGLLYIVPVGLMGLISGFLCSSYNIWFLL